MLNEAPVLEGIRNIHHALAQSYQGQWDASQDYMRRALAYLSELLDDELNQALARDYQALVGIEGINDNRLHQIKTASGDVFLNPCGCWWAYAESSSDDGKGDPLKPVVPVDSEQYRRSDERTQVVLRAIADYRNRNGEPAPKPDPHEARMVDLWNGATGREREIITALLKTMRTVDDLVHSSIRNIHVHHELREHLADLDERLYQLM